MLRPVNGEHHVGFDSAPVYLLHSGVVVVPEPLVGATRKPALGVVVLLDFFFMIQGEAHLNLWLHGAIGTKNTAHGRRRHLTRSGTTYDTMCERFLTLPWPGRLHWTARARARTGRGMDFYKTILDTGYIDTIITSG